MTLQIGAHILKHVRVIAIREHAEEPIVGRNVLNHLIMTLDGPNERLSLDT